MPAGRILLKSISESKKPEIIPLEIRRKVIAKSKAECAHCHKAGFVIQDKFGKPTIFEEAVYKFYINAYDGTFVYRHLPMEFDHVLPLSKGGKTTVENLQILCRRCNRAKGNRKDK